MPVGLRSNVPDTIPMELRFTKILKESKFMRYIPLSEIKVKEVYNRVQGRQSKNVKLSLNDLIINFLDFRLDLIFSFCHLDLVVYD